MRKFNLFFSRFLYISLAIILQVGLTIYFAFYLQKLFFYFFFIVELFALIFAIKLLNKNSNSVTKTSWIVLILAFPFVGVSVYFLFGKDSFSNKVALITDKEIQQSSGERKMTFFLKALFNIV